MQCADVKSLGLLVSFALVACHGEAARRTTPPAPEHVTHTDQAGTRVVSLARETRGVIRLALYIDAGSRDASPPQAATVAAWLAAERGGAQVQALVYPDVTELARSCDPASLRRCVAELARALATRAPASSSVLSARSRLAELRRRALASDPARDVDELALSALLGDAAGGFFPLGRATEDDALTAVTVSSLLRDHYGPTRALLVAAGDVDPTKLQEAVTTSFASVPAALASRASRTLEPEDESRIRTAIDNQPALGFALAAAHESDLHAVASVLSSALSGPLEVSSERATLEPGPRVRGHVFRVRGGALALLRVQRGSEISLAQATRELARLRVEAAGPQRAAAPAARADDLASIAREVGLRFGSTGDDTGAAGPSLAFAAGQLIDGGPGPGPRSKDTREQTEQARRDRAASSFERALAAGAPRTRGDSDQYRAELTTDNGARIDVQYAHGPYVAISVRVALGSQHDPPELHGRSALLATLGATACAGLGPERLAAELTQLGAALEPRVDAESFGLLMRAPRAHWRGALDLALRFARAPSAESAHFADAAVRLQARLGARSSQPRLRARAAAQITPRAPGLCAAWGDPGRIGNLAERDLAQALRETQAGARWAVAVVGPVQVVEASARVARRIADLPAGTAAKPAQPGELEPLPASALTGTPTESATLLVTWDARGSFGHRLGAGIFASAMHALLSVAAGVEVLWQDADVYPGGAFAALELRASPAALPGLPSVLAEALRGFDDPTREQALAQALALAQTAERSAEAEASVRAERLTRLRLGANLSEPSREDARTLLQALRQASPRMTVLR